MSQTKRKPIHRAERRPPPSGRKPTGRLSVRDLTICADELLVFQSLFQSLLARQEQREWFQFYLCGQLSNLARKTVEPMVLTWLGPSESTVRTVQYYLGQAPWKTEPLIERAQDLVAQWLGEPDGVVIVDGSGFPKQGTHSVGVASQYCGHVGKVANSQEGVFILYSSRHGYAFLDQRLYLPEDWFTTNYRQRWKKCAIPEHIAFHTEPELALEMITQLVERAELPFRWVTCDARYGEIPVFLDQIAALQKWYFAEVAVDTRVWLHTPAVEPPGSGLGG